MYKFFDPSSIKSSETGIMARSGECHIHCIEAAAPANRTKRPSAYCGTECHPGCSGHCVDNVSASFVRRPTRADLLAYATQTHHAR